MHPQPLKNCNPNAFLMDTGLLVEGGLLLAFGLVAAMVVLVVERLGGLTGYQRAPTG